MKNKQINLAIQVLPAGGKKHPYAVVDEAIKVIAESGYKYKVCPFETVIEASYQDAIALIEKIQDACYQAGAESLICNLKIQSHSSNQIEIADKMAKYE